MSHHNDPEEKKYRLLNGNTLTLYQTDHKKEYYRVSATRLTSWSNKLKRVQDGCSSIESILKGGEKKPGERSNKTKHAAHDIEKVVGEVRTEAKAKLNQTGLKRWQSW